MPCTLGFYQHPFSEFTRYKTSFSKEGINNFVVNRRKAKLNPNLLLLNGKRSLQNAVYKILDSISTLGQARA